MIQHASDELLFGGLAVFSGGPFAFAGRSRDDMLRLWIMVVLYTVRGSVGEKFTCREADERVSSRY